MSPAAIRTTFEFRIKPTRGQEVRLRATLAACRFVYNWALEDRRTLWQYCHVSTSFNDQSAYLKHLKEAHPWLTDVHAHPLQDALKRLDRSFERFFKAHPNGHGHPRFKGRHQYDSFTFKEWENGASFSGKRLFLSKIGRVRIVLHRPIVGQVKTCTIKHRADGWVALFSVIQAPSWRSIDERDPVGIDVGLESFATLSTREKIENPRVLRNSERELRIAQRKVSRRKKGSGRRRKAVQHLRLVHLRIQRSRKSFHFTEAFRLAERFHPLFVEDLSIRNMVQNPKLAKSISDASWGQFLGILSRSAERAGGATIAVEARGTSQECVCGEPVPKDLSVRIHRCPRCRLVEDRDVVSARLIQKRGLEALVAAPVGQVIERLRLGRPVGEGAGSNRRPRIREAAGL